MFILKIILHKKTQCLKFFKVNEENWKKPWIKVGKRFCQHCGRKYEITGSGLQISKKQSIPNNDKKSLFNLQFIINNFNNSPFHYFSTHPPPRCFFTPPRPLFLQNPSPPPVASSNGYPNEIQENSTAFFQPKMKLWIFCENITKLANSSLVGGGEEGGSLITNSKKLFSFAPLLQSRLTSFSHPPPPPQKKPLSPLIRCKKRPYHSIFAMPPKLRCKWGREIE